ncbi:MAG: hypothetical protein WCF04_12990, partial [Candidatus Nanopelagicales bacterium]
PGDGDRADDADAVDPDGEGATVSGVLLQGRNWSGLWTAAGVISSANRLSGLWTGCRFSADVGSM